MHAITTYVIIFFFLFMALAVNANIGDYDDHWKQRAEDAWARANATYRADPEAETEDFNAEVYKILEDGNNSTRRNLRARKHNEECKATNPIDRCWRCRKNWASQRKWLAKCAKGFGRKAKGGKDGEFYVVTSPLDTDVIDPKPGTLRYGAIQNRPLWIVFAHDMVIYLSQELIINSYKTIDARGANVHIAGGAGLTIQFVHNVIIHGLRIHGIKPGSGGFIKDSETHIGFRTMSDGDGISIFGSSKIWIDHVSMSNCADGLIDIIHGSTAITISNCHFTHQDHVLLLGANDAYKKDQIMQVTIAFNHFGKGLVQRMPRCRWGFFHVVNNDYTHWLMYAIGGSQHATIISQGNRYTASGNHVAKEVTKRIETAESEWKDWTWRSQGDLMRNGAFFTESGSRDIKKFKKQYSSLNMIKFKPGRFVTRLTRFAGALTSKIGQKC